MKIAEKHWLIENLLSLQESDAISLLRSVRKGNSIASSINNLLPKVSTKDTQRIIEEMGVIGNVWVRMQYYPKANEPAQGHKHHHDHVSLLAKGKLRVKVEGHTPVIYTAPTFFKIAAEHEHELIPLEDDTVAYCIFAIRNQDGEVVDEFDGNTAHYGHNHET